MQAPGAHSHDGLLPALQSVLVLTVLAVFVVTFVAQPFRIPSESMQPTLDVGDFLLVNKQVLAPHGPLDILLPHAPMQRGDIAVFHYPVDESVHMVKRVVALPGDRVQMRRGRLRVNGAPAQEPFAVFAPGAADAFRDDFPSLHSVDTDVDARWWAQLRASVREGEVVVPRGCYFVLGDNRNDSEDSRYWGFVHEDELVGKPVLVYFALPPAGGGLPLRAKLRLALQEMRVVR